MQVRSRGKCWGESVWALVEKVGRGEAEGCTWIVLVENDGEIWEGSCAKARFGSTLLSWQWAEMAKSADTARMRWVIGLGYWARKMEEKWWSFCPGVSLEVTQIQESVHWSWESLACTDLFLTLDDFWPPLMPSVQYCVWPILLLLSSLPYIQPKVKI